MNVNKVIIAGRITNDIELKALPSGVKVASFSIATNKYFKDKNGDKQEKVEFHNIVIFGNMAENVSRFMSKGSLLYVEGELQTRSWEDQSSGKKMYRTEILAQNVQFGPSSNGSGGKSKSSKENYGNGVDSFPDDEINPEDIPF